MSKKGLTVKGRGSRIAAAAPAVKTPKSLSKWLPYVIPAIPALVLLWAYLPVMHAPFVFDDTNQQYALPTVDAPLRTWIGPVRPILMLSYWASAQVSKSDTWPFHAMNLAIHLAAAFFAFLVIRRLLEWSGSEARTRTWFAGFGAVLFLLHPLQTESVAYIAGRSEALSGMFALASITAFFYRKSAAISWATVMAVLLLFGAALLSKEQAIVVPAVLLLTDIWWHPEFSLKGVFRNWKLYGLMAMGGLAGVALFWKLILGRGTGGSAGFGIMPWYQYLFTQFRALWVYIISFVWPTDLNVDWEFSISRSIFEHGSIIGLAGLAAMGWAAWHYRRRFRLAAYGYFLFLIFLLPTSSVLPIKDPIADRRMYLPLIGLTLITIDFVSRWQVNRRVLAGIGVGILVVLSVMTHARAVVWTDPVALWEDSAAKSPGKSRPHFQLAQTYAFAGRYDLAVPEFEKAGALTEPSFDLMLDWGLAYDGTQQYTKAIEKLRQAIPLAQSPRDACHAQTQIAKVYADQHDWANAVTALDAAEKLDPGFPSIYAYKGMIRLANNDPEGGARECRRALAVDAAFQPAQDCVAMAQKMGAK
jgi:tetratricopeptide (TPR) repeat protein